MNKDTIELLKETDAGTKTAVNSIKAVLDDIESQPLMTILTDSLREHQKIGDEVHQTLNSLSQQGKDPALMARTMSKMKIGIKLMEKPGDKTVANLMFDGCSMGIKQLSEYLNEYSQAEEKAVSLARRLILEEEKLSEALKAYL